MQGERVHLSFTGSVSFHIALYSPLWLHLFSRRHYSPFLLRRQKNRAEVGFPVHYANRWNEMSFEVNVFNEWLESIVNTIYLH